MPKTNYSDIAEYYDEARPEPANTWIEWIGTLGVLRPGARVLDLGCGTGRFALKTQERHGCEMFGLDSSVEMLAKAAAKDRSGVVRWIAGDAHSPPFRRGSFDSVYMTMVVHHLERLESALRETHNLLSPGGRCLVLTTSHSAIRSHILRYFPGVVAIDLKRFPSIPSLKRAMMRAGFKNVSSRLVRHQEDEVPVERYLDMVRRKYISTFELMDESHFQTGLGVFEDRLRKLYGDKMRRVLMLTFVVGEK